MALLGKLVPNALNAVLQHASVLQHALPAAYYASQRSYITKRSRAAKKDQQAAQFTPAANQEDVASSSSSSSDSAPAATAAAAHARAAHGSTAGSIPAADSQQVAALDAAMKHLNKKLGSGTIMRLGETPATHMECISTGCLTLDIALGGGWPKGRIVEVYGPESSGKSTLALHAIAEVQKAGGQALLVDAEHAFNREFARKLGVNLKELIVCQPSCGEEALEVVDTVLRSHAVQLIAVDSVAALLPRAEHEGDIGMAQVAGQARLMSQALRKLTGVASRTNCTIIFINQLRYKVGVLFGSPETTSGGNALKFYASQRVDVRVREKVMGPDKVEAGVRVKAKVVKNKVAPPYRSAEFIIQFNKGIDMNATLLEACELLGIVTAKGSHYYYKEQKLGHGRDAASARLAGDEALRSELTGLVRKALQDPAALEAALDADGPAAAGPESDDEDDVKSA